VADAAATGFVGTGVARAAGAADVAGDAAVAVTSEMGTPSAVAICVIPGTAGVTDATAVAVNGRIAADGTGVIVAFAPPHAARMTRRKARDIVLMRRIGPSCAQ
jgi:hypothetical protein